MQPDLIRCPRRSPRGDALIADFSKKIFSSNVLIMLGKAFDYFAPLPCMCGAVSFEFEFAAVVALATRYYVEHATAVVDLRQDHTLARPHSSPCTSFVCNVCFWVLLSCVVWFLPSILQLKWDCEVCCTC